MVIKFVCEYVKYIYLLKCNTIYLMLKKYIFIICTHRVQIIESFTSCQKKKGHLHERYIFLIYL